MHKTMWLLAAVVVLGSRSAAAEVRVVELGPTLPNPTTLKLAAPAKNTDSTALGVPMGQPCSGYYDTSTTPTVRLKVAQAIRFDIQVAGGLTSVLRFPNGGFLCALNGRDYHEELQPGEYAIHVLFREQPKGAAPVVVRLSRPGAPVDLPASTTRVALEDLTQPLVVKGKTQAERPGAGCSQTTRGADPDLLLTSDRPRDDVRLLLLDRAGTQRLEVIAPAQYLDPYRPPSCAGVAGALATVGRLEEPRAVYVSDAPGAAARDFALVVLDASSRLDPIWFPLEVPAGLPVRERVVGQFAPFAREERSLRWSPLATARWVHDMFLGGPKGLFVYAKADLDGAKARLATPGQPSDVALPGPRRDEPLLVIAARRGVFVQSADGEIFEVPEAELSTTAPAAPALPAGPRRALWYQVAELLEAAGPPEQKAIKAYEALRAKSDRCFSEFWAKHYPNAPANVNFYEVTYVDGKVTSVVDYADKVTAQAARKCGVQKTQKAADALRKRLEKHAVELRARQLAAVRAGFAR